MTKTIEPQLKACSIVDRFFEFSLLGLLASGYLAVVGSGYLDLPTVLLTAVALILRGLLVAGLVRFEVPSRVVAAITLSYMGFYPLDYAFFSRAFLPATVHLIFFIAIVKIVTAATNRDYFFVKLIAFMELLAACVLSTSINFFLFLALFLLLGVATFASSEIRRSGQMYGAGVNALRTRSRGVSWRLAAATIFVSTGILLLTGALFFLLPRTARAAFQHMLSHRYHLAGFSNEISLGEIGEIKKHDTPVMHVKMDPAQDRPQYLRWRGSALAQFDGRRWFNSPWRGEVLRPEAGGQLRLSGWRPGKGISYIVHINDMPLDGVLFFAGTPQYLHIDAPLILHTPVDSYRLISGNTTNVNYQVYSYLDLPRADLESTIVEPPPIRLTTDLRELYLRLPPLDMRIGALAQSVSAVGRTPEAKARAIENYLRRTYQYTLELPQTETAEPLANFLFHRKKGHCEYFASSMAVMLRAVGIPSRVVTGFLGGIYNPISGWQVIRASDAHSWVEAYIPRLGWTTYDPTPPDPHPAALSAWSRLGLYVDAAEVFWQDWIINYNLDRQLLLASQMEQSGHNFRLNWMDELGASWITWKTRTADLGPIYLSVLIPALVAAILWGLYGKRVLQWWRTHRRIRKVQRGEVHRTDATLLYERMLKALQKRGIEKPAWLTPFEFARVVNEPSLAILVEDITSAYNELRFGGDTQAAIRMMRLINRLESFSG